MTAEKKRLAAQRMGVEDWRRWGPYVSERQWGTVREDYSANGDVWGYLTHDEARSRAYRWGEDGIAGMCDHLQRLCLGVALWNGRDPILKERFFGLTNPEGNHGEDVKELYYHLDATPSHSYLKLLYKYPQREFPYGWLVSENQRRSRNEPEFELLDTGVFNDNRYFDLFIEYAKAAPDDLLMQITVCNRGPDEVLLHVLPQAWFRNTWSWEQEARKPRMRLDNGTLAIEHEALGPLTLHAEGTPHWLFCENESNTPRLWNTPPPTTPAYFKDGIHEAIVKGRADAVNPAQVGTKAAAHYALTLSAGGEAVLRLRLTSESVNAPFERFEEILTRRHAEADEFYAELQSEIHDEDARAVQRQAFAGMIWNKQFYFYDVEQWLNGDPTQPPPPPERLRGRNWDWTHLNNAEVMSMPDSWEYPWYAAWDLAFHCIPLALVDAEFAKDQLILLNRVWYLHPNGQLPAYEWNFSDVNPPVHAWAAWRVFQIDRKQRGDMGDFNFLERVFLKLVLNFTWWVNRKDTLGLNIFQGGFLGLDNIGVFNRSDPLPTGGFINQADGTAWMAMYCLNLMRIALELSLRDCVYEDMATKFFEHFLYIAKAMTNMAGTGMGLWDEQDGFYYDALHLPDRCVPLRIRSIVGLIPLFAIETLEPALLARVPGFTRRLEWFLKHRPDLAQLVSRWYEPGTGERRMLSLLRGHRMKCLLRRMLDETQFLSDHGVRGLSREYRDHPFELDIDGHRLSASYLPAESDSGLFGGNSNWRGPVWFPLNFLIIESLQKFHHYYGDDFKIECPTGSGRFITINDVADELTRRLTRIFLRDADGRRPVFGAAQKLQTDPHFRDYVLFQEYFDGDNGHGCGASHQTGWTGLIAKLLQPRRPVSKKGGDE